MIKIRLLTEHSLLQEWKTSNESCVQIIDNAQDETICDVFICDYSYMINHEGTSNFIRHPQKTIYMIGNEVGIKPTLIRDYNAFHIMSLDEQGVAGLMRLINHIHNKTSFNSNELYTTDAKVIHSEISSTVNVSYVIEDLIAKTNFDNCFQDIKAYVKQILNELVMNGLYNAPVDEAGHFLYAAQSRKESVDLLPGQSVQMTTFSTDDYITLIVEDCFGSLKKEVLNKYLSKPESGKVKHEDKSGGAGLGLHLVTHFSTELYVNLIPGSKTEFICHIKKEKRYKKYLEQIKSFHFFHLEGAMGQVFEINPKLKASKQIKDGICYLSFIGDIDEDFKSDNLSEGNCARYLIDFNEVEMINSCGIREWITFLEGLAGAQIIYVNCPQIIVQQINMVDGFMTNKSLVHTFYAPYYCEECDYETKKLVKGDDVKDMNAPVVNCPKCEAEMELDAHEKQYFQFLKKAA